MFTKRNMVWLQATAAFELNATASPLFMRPGGVYTVTAVATIPANSTLKALFDVKLPVNDTAVMTVRDIRIQSAGKNLACLGTQRDEEFIKVFNSSQDTSQFDRVTFDVRLTNTGKYGDQETIRPMYSYKHSIALKFTVHQRQGLSLG